VSISTKRGDDGTTGLFYGGRARKDSARIETVGAIDEAQAALGVARAQARADKGAISLDEELTSLERGLWVVMAEVATAPRNRSKLSAGVTLVSAEMVEDLSRRVLELEASIEMPTEFVVPGQSLTSAALDLARTLVRRAERHAVALGLGELSLVVAYLNRLSDLCWLLARACEHEHLTARAKAVRACGAKE
jgi:cob(I)alamin adenosyltransferase